MSGTVVRNVLTNSLHFICCSVVLLWRGWVLYLHSDPAHSAGGFCSHLEPEVGGERGGGEQ